MVWHALPLEIVIYPVPPAGGQPPDSASTRAGGLPAPLAQPLPQLSALVRGTPSPLLRWQVLDLLYSYCLAMRLYNGDWSSQAQVQHTLCGGATSCLPEFLRLWPVLAQALCLQPDHLHLVELLAASCILNC